MKKKKSFFSILSSFIIWFIFCFIFQVNAFDSIKNIFKQSLESIKKGYNRLTGNNEKVPQIERKTPILEKNNPPTDSDPVKPIESIQAENLLDTNTQEILDYKTVKNTSSSETKQTELSNYLTLETTTNTNEETDNKVNQYLALLKYNKHLNDKTIEKIKKTILTKLEENPDYIKKIEKNIKKQIKKATEKKIQSNISDYKKNNTDTPQNSATNSQSQDLAEPDKKSAFLQQQSEIREIENKEKAQIEKLLLHDKKKNQLQSPNPALKSSEQKYKEKYFHLVQSILQRHKNDIKTIKEKFVINKNNTTHPIKQEVIYEK
jgi:hypothetical protein